jgi:hypothetical protein
MSARLVALLMAAILGDPSRHGQALNNASPGGRAGCYFPRVDDHAFLDHVAQVLSGRLPTPEYPAALRERAPRVWWDRAERTFGYARDNHAPYGRLAQCAGLVSQAASQSAHAVLAARGQWVTNEKRLLTSAGLRQVDEFIALASPDPDVLRAVVDRSRRLCHEAVQQATDPG